MTGRCCLLLLLVTLGVTPALASDLEINDQAGQDQDKVVFNWYTQRCNQFDTPDAPARVFRDYKGLVHLVSSHEETHQLVGTSLGKLTHPCRPVYRASHDDNPAHFDDRQWLTSFVTTDGRNVDAIVHDEFWGYLRPSLCPSRLYMHCWYNAITMASSTDGGYSYHELTAPRNLVASIPYKYAKDVGRPIGYFQPTNVVYKKPYYYFMFHAEQFQAQRWGECVARSSKPQDPLSWKGWDGSAFDVTFVDPYVVQSSFPNQHHVCAPVGKGRFFDVGSLLYDPISDLFVLTSSIGEGSGSHITPAGVYYSLSRDLLQWGDPRLIVKISALHLAADSDGLTFGCFSLVDQNSPSLSFDTMSTISSLRLYYVRFFKNGAPYARELVSRPLKLIRVGSG